jgi:hypothetical protein
MRPLLVAMISSVVTTGCIVGEDLPDEDRPDVGAKGIVNPTDGDDRAHFQIGKLAMANRTLCSSTLIAPRVAVTAAHCLRDTTVTSFTSDGFQSPVVAQVMHPGYEGGVEEDDIALVLLRDPAPYAPAWMDRDPARVGMRVLAVGFGITGYTNTDSGRRRSGTVKIEHVGDVRGDMLSTLPDPSNICSGDSGGALLDGSRLLGVTSGTALVGGTGCTDRAFFARIDRHYRFLADQVGAWGQVLASPLYGCGRLDAGTQLLPGQVKSSCNGRYQLIHQTDGNVVLYELADGLIPRWASWTHGKQSSTLAMQTDGNLVLYGPAGALFHTHTYGMPGTVAVVQDDGNFVLYAPGSRPVWASNTGR